MKCVRLSVMEVTHLIIDKFYVALGPYSLPSPGLDPLRMTAHSPLAELLSFFSVSASSFSTSASFSTYGQWVP